MDYDPSNVRQARKVSDINMSEMRIDRYLTNFSVDYRRDESDFAAGFASTSIPVRNESDKYTVFPQGYFLRDEAEVRALGGRPVQVRYKVGSDNYLAEEWALEHTIDDRQRRNVEDPFDLDENGVRLLEGKQMIREERIWVTSFFSATAGWTFNLTGGVDFDPFNDQASDPITFINQKKTSMKLATGKKPNTLVLGANVADALMSNADIIERVKYTQRGVIDLDLLAAVFGVTRVRVAGAVYNTANEGAEDDLEFIADPNGMWMGYIEPRPSMAAPTAIARFGWTGLIPGSTNQFGGVITRGRDDRAYSDWIHSRNAYDYKMVSPDLGMYFTNANVPNS